MPFGVDLACEPVAVQQITADNFPLLRTVGTGSWVVRSHHGLGIGTEMRAAALSFAFDHLGAEFAITAAYTHAAASLHVSHKLGYETNGVRRDVVRGRAAEASLVPHNAGEVAATSASDRRLRASSAASTCSHTRNPPGSDRLEQAGSTATSERPTSTGGPGASPHLDTHPGQG